MTVFWVCANAIARMKCAVCHAIMNQGERERNPYTPEGQPIHQACLDKQAKTLPPQAPEPGVP
jgi:hypothetical protein